MCFYTIYKTTNMVNGKYYIGQHKTNNPYDSYMGSGKLIKFAIEKYGINSFKKEVLFVFDNKEECNLKEKELVNPNDPNSYNLMEGGRGGWDYMHENYPHSWIGRKHTSEYKKHLKEINTGKNNPRYGIEVSEETKEKMRNSWTKEKREAQSKRLREYAKKPKTKEIREKMRIAALKKMW